jgi:hypothetical protein
LEGAFAGLMVTGLFGAAVEEGVVVGKNDHRGSAL